VRHPAHRAAGAAHAFATPLETTAAEDAVETARYPSPSPLGHRSREAWEVAVEPGHGGDEQCAICRDNHVADVAGIVVRIRTAHSLAPGDVPEGERRPHADAGDSLKLHFLLVHPDAGERLAAGSEDRRRQAPGLRGSLPAAVVQRAEQLARG